MTPKELSQENDRLKQELAKKDEQIAGLTKRVEELDKQKPASKSRQQALAALELLKAGPVSQAQLKTLNEKYPSDPIFYVRSILKLDVKTVRVPGKGSCYMLPEHFKVYADGLAREKAAQEASKQEVKEELTPPPKASTRTQAAAHV